jgi:hypothetical protein
MVRHQILYYNPENGKLYWRRRTVSEFPDMAFREIIRWNVRYAEKEAFTALQRGVPIGKLFGKVYFAHRIIFKYVHGYEPPQVDHINGNPFDNRIVNLRAADSITNNRNAKRRKDNKTGVVGVFWDNKSSKWRAKIGDKFIGLFESYSDACAARSKAQKLYGFHPNHGRA